MDRKNIKVKLYYRKIKGGFDMQIKNVAMIGAGAIGEYIHILYINF